MCWYEVLPLDKLAALNKIIGGRLKLSPAGVDLIASFEGFSPTPYNDPAGNATIGYGFLLHLGPVTDEDRNAYPNGIGEAEAKAQLATKAQEYGDCMSRSTYVVLNQNQYDAMASFTYNVGCGGYINSSVRVAVEHGGDVRDALMQYIRGTDGVAYAGLINRRRAEGQLYYHEEDGLSQAQYDELKAACAQNKTDIQGTFGLALRTAQSDSQLGHDFADHIQKMATANDATMLAALKQRMDENDARLANIGKILAP